MSKVESWCAFGFGLFVVSAIGMAMYMDQPASAAELQNAVSDSPCVLQAAQAENKVITRDILNNLIKGCKDSQVIKQQQEAIAKR